MTDHPGTNFSADRLKSFVSRIEKLNEDKDAVLLDIRDIYAELKSTGFDPKIVRQTVRLRKMEENKRREMQELLELYSSVLGME